MDLNIKDKIIIVTGGAKGIGEGISRAIANEGWIPVIAGRSSDAAQNLVRDLAGKGLKVHKILAELSSAQNCKRVVDETLEEFGRIDGLVKNAGVNDGVGLQDG